MKNILSFSVFCLFAFYTLTAEAQGIIVTPNNNATQLVNNHLLGSGIFASSITGNLAAGASGSFTASGNASFTLNGGIIISTGSVTALPTTPTFLAATALNTPGHPLLNNIVAPLSTLDAQSISFVFKATSDSVEFNFVFASEEYNDYVNTVFNDVFGFFVTGPGFAPNTNVALIPGTTTPIAINTINNGGPYPVGSSGPCTNCNYYIDNLVQPTPIAFAFDGFTTSIKIKFPVWPCADYTFTIAIADVADRAIDSSVLLEAGSFVPCPGMLINHKLTSSSPDTAYLCTGGSLTLTAPPGPNYYWTTGQTTQSITVTQPGTYMCSYLEGSCFAQTYPLVVIQSGNIQTPVISQNGSVLESNIIASPGIIYQWSFNGNVIPGATQSTYTPTPSGLYILKLSNEPGDVRLPLVVRKPSYSLSVAQLRICANLRKKDKWDLRSLVFETFINSLIFITLVYLIRA
jgi:hypothetical protein